MTVTCVKGADDWDLIYNNNYSFSIQHTAYNNQKIDLISNIITSDLKQRVGSIGRVYEPLNKSMLGFVTILSPVSYELICKTMNHMIAKEGGDLVKLTILTWLVPLVGALIF